VSAPGTFAVIFVANSCRYTCHASDCPQAVTKVHRRGGSEQFRIEREFTSIEAARAFADADESEKAGEPTKAIWRVCGCAKR